MSACAFFIVSQVFSLVSNSVENKELFETILSSKNQSDSYNYFVEALLNEWKIQTYHFNPWDKFGKKLLENWFIFELKVCYLLYI